MTNISVYLRQSVVAELRVLAARDGLSVNAWVRALIAQRLEAETP